MSVPPAAAVPPCCKRSREHWPRALQACGCAAVTAVASAGCTHATSMGGNAGLMPTPNAANACPLLPALVDASRRHARGGWVRTGPGADACGSQVRYLAASFITQTNSSPSGNPKARQPPSVSFSLQRAPPCGPSTCGPLPRPPHSTYSTGWGSRRPKNAARHWCLRSRAAGHYTQSRIAQAAGRGPLPRAGPQALRCTQPLPRHRCWAAGQFWEGPAPGAAHPQAASFVAALLAAGCCTRPFPRRCC